MKQNNNYLGTPAWVTPTPRPITTPHLGKESSPSSCSGPDRGCGDFTTHDEAQAFFVACGGPGSDLHKLDRDNDDEACEDLP